MAIGSPQWMYASGEAYELEQSLKFNDDDSAYLSWTPSSAGNRTTWTWSGWIKLGSAGDGWHMIFSAGSSSNSGSTGENLTGLLLYNDTLYIYWDSAAGGTNPAMKLRDPSAWYHVCLVATSSSLACYINGTLAGTKSGSGNGAINNTLNHGIGIRGDSLTSPFDGYMSEIHFIDGTAKAPSNFAETGTYGEWKPIEYSGTYGTNGFYLNFAGGGVISSATGGNSTGTTGDYKYKTYTSSGTFTPGNDGLVEYLVVGGGGGGGSKLGGGGGGGGFRTGFVEVTGSTAYTVTVGAGGSYDADGSDSSISGTGITTITATGGGHGGAGDATSATGGSGGGGAGIANTSGSAGTSGQGNAGGDGAGSNGFAGGGGGGAGAAGADGVQSGKGGDGGAGLQSNIDTNNYYYSGGGGGGAHFAPSTGAGDGGIGGGGGGARGGGSTDGGTEGNGTGGGSARNSGGSPADATNQPGGDGGANTGGGGGGAPNNANAGGAGGSGIVIIRYKFQ